MSWLINAWQDYRVWCIRVRLSAQMRRFARSRGR